MLTRGEDPIQLRARALGLVLALLACACAEPPALLAGRLTYLELRRIEGQEQPRPPRAVLRVGIPEGSRRWGVHVERPAILPGEGATEVRVWKGGGQVHVPGPVDLSGVNRVEVVGRVRAGHQFELKLVDGEEELVTEGLRAETSGAPRADGLERLALDLQGLPEAHARAWQALDFTVRGRDCEVHALEFLEVAPEDLLPDAADPRQVALAGEYRRCAGLAAERGLEASFDAAPGDELVFGLGVPAHVQAPLERAEVVVTLQAGGAQELVRFPLQDLAEVGRGWTTQRLSLESFAGLRVRARWELHNAGAARVAAVLGLPRVGQRDARAPTVLLITSDTHRADHLAAASDGIEIRTPILDALAARGVLFEDCFSESHITCPSHASILTGLSPRDTGLVSNTQRLAGTALTLARVFRESGYTTLGVLSSFHLGPQGGNLAKDFDRLAVPPGSAWSSEQSVSRLLEWLDDAEGHPVFAWIHLFDAHEPYAPPGEFDRLYYPASKDPYDPALPALELNADEHQVGLQGLRDIEFPRAQYRAEVSYIDQQLGRLLDHPRMDSAVIAFTSDHGEALYHPDGIFDHLKLLPGTLSVPLVLVWPGAPRGAAVRAPVVQVDVGRTLLELAGIDAPGFPGRSLLDTLEPAGRREEPRFALGDHASHASVAVGQWFLILHLRDSQRRGFAFERHGLELYDRDADPAGLTDMASSQVDVVRGLRRLLIEWLNRPQALTSAEEGHLGAEQMAQLRALGYTGDLDSPAEAQLFDPECPCERCAPYR